MEDLIKKLGSAEYGSRELDIAIHLAFLPATPDESLEKALPYSTSLDAALTLVPEGWSGGFEFGPTQNGIQFDANLWNGQFAPDAVEVSSIAKTSPLALCVAALKARQASND